eukprot:gene7481-biopygen440
MLGRESQLALSSSRAYFKETAGQLEALEDEDTPSASLPRLGSDVTEKDSEELSLCPTGNRDACSTGG